MHRLMGLLLLCLLGGCMDAAVTGAQTVYNRHSLKKTLNDHEISLRAGQAIYVASKAFQDTHVSVSCFNGTILLTGQVTTASQRTRIEMIVQRIAAENYPAPTTLYNRIEVAPPASSLTRLSDSWITTKIITQLVASEEVDPSQIKVITENGTVYLMGTVPPDQGKAAIDIARTTDGVQEVVKVFKWVRISRT